MENEYHHDEQPVDLSSQLSQMCPSCQHMVLSSCLRVLFFQIKVDSTQINIISIFLSLVSHRLIIQLRIRKGTTRVFMMVQHI